MGDRDWCNYLATTEYREITIGIEPFSRYYLNIGRKKKMFAELKGNYALLLEKGTKVYQKQHLMSYGAAIGWSNFINKM